MMPGIIGSFAFLLGFTFMTVAIVMGLRKRSRIKRSTKTMGVVIKNETSLGMRSGSGARSTLYKPTVRFQTADGRVVDHTPLIFTNTANYAVGQNVEVYYDPQRPEEAIAGVGIRLWWNLLIFGAVGGIFAIVGAFFILFAVIAF
jgi:hypothetical protein